MLPSTPSAHHNSPAQQIVARKIKWSCTVVDRINCVQQLGSSQPLIQLQLAMQTARLERAWGRLTLQKLERHTARFGVP